MYFNKKYSFFSKFYGLLGLMRVNKPIGFFLFLWPTLWTLCLSIRKIPDIEILIMFIMSVFLMRALGCVINDYIDKDIDCYVKRTCNRPLISGVVNFLDVLVLFFILFCILCVLLIVFDFKINTIFLSLIVLILTCVYPYTKRYMSFPQLFLGVTFGFSTFIIFSVLNIPIYNNKLPWLLFFINIIWIVIYDTEYAMVDRDDDIVCNIKSSAIFFGHYDRIFVGILQVIMLIFLIIIGAIFKFNFIFYIALIGVGILFIWQQLLIASRQSEKCFRAFLSNNYVGMLIFFGIFIDL